MQTGQESSLADKVALITGGARGIGKGCAWELARRGAHVVVNDRPGSRELSATVSEVQSHGGRCTGIEADVFSREGCQQLVDNTLEQSAQIDILVSNPAWNPRRGFLEEKPDDFERSIRATLIAGFHISQLVARHMVGRGGGGKLLFISSVQAELPIAGNIAYGPAKAGLNHLTRAISVELAEHQIQVNCIEPGWIDTPGEHESFDAATIREEGSRLPLGRLGTPEDIGRAAAFLCSPEADYITGSVLCVDGGYRYKDCRPHVVIPTKGD